MEGIIDALLSYDVSIYLHMFNKTTLKYSRPEPNSFIDKTKNAHYTNQNNGYKLFIAVFLYLKFSIIYNSNILNNVTYIVYYKRKK